MSMGERRHRRDALVAAVGAAIALFGGVGPARAFTTPACLARKLKAWGELRQCERKEDAKAVQGRTANRAGCQVHFAATLAAVDVQATRSAIPCRYRDNGDSTVTDFDTGLMWAKQNAFDGQADPLNVLDVDDTFTLPFAAAVAPSLTGTSDDGITLTPVPGIGAHDDWRLPTIVELGTIVDTTTLGCQVGGGCIDPVFGLTAATFYWSATTSDGTTGWLVSFRDGTRQVASPNFGLHARAVRSAF